MMMTTAIVAIRQSVCMCLLLDMRHGFLGHSENTAIPRESSGSYFPDAK